MPDIMRSLDEALRREKPVLATRFAPLTDDLIQTLAVSAPRSAKKRLMQAYAKAARRAGVERKRRSIQLTAEDFSWEAVPPIAGAPTKPGYRVVHVVIDQDALSRLH